MILVVGRELMLIRTFCRIHRPRISCCSKRKGIKPRLARSELHALSYSRAGVWILTKLNFSVDHWHYVKGALSDKTKTWRIQYRSENTWVKHGGEWKLQYNKLYDLAYGAERPFY